MSEIIKEKLFLGSIDDALNVQWLKSNSIKLIITVMNEPLSYIDQIKSLTNSNNIEHHVISISDMPNENILENIHDICQMVDTCDKVLLHCMFGISRSATVTIAYIMLKYKLYLDDATKMVLKERNFIFPNDGFILQLIKLENATFGLMTYLPNLTGFAKYKILLHGYDN